MSNTCFTCHGPDKEDNDSGYRLDRFENAVRPLESDQQVKGIVPGKPDQSEVYLRIAGLSDGEQMPPLDFRHQLSDYEKSLFRKWIAQGAEYEQHWSYAPVTKPTPPKPGRLADEVDNQIDAFVVARLEREGLQPADLADKASLLRRLSLDLTGLPPTLQELTDFRDDRSPDAYSKQVDRLLASPAFGERMASVWLDLVRFADTVGFHGDQNQRAFPYRDYVINAFNENKPFDQFAREQLAGDLFPKPTDDQLTATGFLRLNMVTREGGAQPGEYLAKYKADRVRSVGTAFLGATLGCCECHNHKYDPFTAKDFYSLGAFFDDLQQWGVYSNYSYTPNPDLQGFNNDYPFPPELRVDSQSAKAEIEALQRERDHLLAQAIQAASFDQKALQKWVDSTAKFINEYKTGWKILKPDSVVATHQTSIDLQQDDSVLLSGKGDPKEAISFEHTFSQPISISSLQLRILPDAKHAGNTGRSEDGRFSVSVTASFLPAGVAMNSGDFALANEKAKSPAASRSSAPAVSQETVVTEHAASKPAEVVAQPVEWSYAEADRFSSDGYKSGAPKLEIAKRWKSGPERWQLPGNEQQLPHTAIFQLKKPMTAKPGDRLIIRLATSDIGRFQISVSPFANPVPGSDAASASVRSAITTPSAQRSFSDNAAVLSAWQRATTAADQLPQIAGQYQKKIAALHSGQVMTLIAQKLPGDQIPASRVLPRGNWQDKSGEAAPPAFPHFLPGSSVDGDRRLNRLDLANWLTAEENPLTARHFVNRTWKQFFGTGLSSRLDDLGNQGEWPSHPELLDWLAAEFMESGWNVKHLIRLMVISRTYRRAASERSDLVAADPYNRLLAQQAARRLPAELIRDNALAIAGLLRTDYIGGPSIFPYQPDGHYRNLQFPNRTYVPNSDFRQYRRGVYMHWQRTFLHPMLVNFDAPSRDECTADRTMSNSPQQALTLLNDPTFAEAAVGLAMRIRNLSPNDLNAQIDTAFRLAVARPASPSEKQSLARLYQQQLTYFEAHPDEAQAYLKYLQNSTSPQIDETETTVSAIASLSMVCRVVLNLHETITRY